MGAAVLVAGFASCPSPAAAAPAPSDGSPQDQAQAAGLAFRTVSDERARTASAIVLRRTVVRARPSASAPRIGTVGVATYLGSAETVLVLASARFVAGATVDPGAAGPPPGAGAPPTPAPVRPPRIRAWSYVRFPGDGSPTGWVPADRLGPVSFTDTRLVIDVRRRRAILLRGDQVLLRAPVAVGRPRTPTPTGRAYVREILVPRTPGGAYGVLALGLSAYSEAGTDWPGGGQVGIHGTNAPGLIPGRVTHGCVRLTNRAILRLGRWVTVGTPVEIR